MIDEVNFQFCNPCCCFISEIGSAYARVSDFIAANFGIVK